eukprot:jgi/Botrbrau1/430/Bobra.110_2s0080.1
MQPGHPCLHCTAGSTVWHGARLPSKSRWNYSCSPLAAFVWCWGEPRGTKSPWPGAAISYWGTCVCWPTHCRWALYFLATKLFGGQVSARLHLCLGIRGASVLMGVTSALFVDRKAWSMPPALLGPLIYWVFVVSVTGYYIVAWATHYLPASQVAAFVCLQPFLGTLLAFLVLGEQPSVWDLGALGILFGLLLVTTDKADKTDRTAVAQLLARMRRLVNQAPLATLVKPERE